MGFSNKHLLVFIAFISMINVRAQYTDTSAVRQITKDTASSVNKWNVATTKRTARYRKFIVPGILMVYGFASLESNYLKRLDVQMKNELYLEHPHKKTKIDDYLRFAPGAAVYGLNALGTKGRNNFRDRTMIYLMSNAIMTSSVFGIKKLTNVLRPDNSDYYSFPSGHAAAAFASAEFLRQEYKVVSSWYGIAGYMVAGTTGYLRMYNNKHWMSDVLAGAGIGIASTKLAYLAYPTIKRKFFKDKPMNTLIMPYYQSGGAGIAMVYNFR